MDNLPKYLANDPPEPAAADEDTCLRSVLVEDDRVTGQLRVDVANVVVATDGQR